jgi:hypothetical protein
MRGQRHDLQPHHHIRVRAGQHRLARVGGRDCLTRLVSTHGWMRCVSAPVSRQAKKRPCAMRGGPLERTTMPDAPTYRIQRGHGLPQFICLRCHYSALSENQLLIHLQMIHQDSTMICEPEPAPQASPAAEPGDHPSG